MMPISARNNSDLYAPLTFLSGESVPYPLTDARLTAHVRRQSSEPAAVLHLSTDAGSIRLINAAEGEIAFVLPWTEIAHLSGTFEFDLVAEWGSERRVLLADTIAFEEGITR